MDCLHKFIDILLKILLNSTKILLIHWFFIFFDGILYVILYMWLLLLFSILLRCNFLFCEFLVQFLLFRTSFGSVFVIWNVFILQYRLIYRVYSPLICPIKRHLCTINCTYGWDRNAISIVKGRTRLRSSSLTDTGLFLPGSNPKNM